MLSQSQNTQLSKQEREILIPTATAIITQQKNPFMILVGESSKHTKPVLPGGKIDISDLISSSLENSAERCIIREIKEEVGIAVTELKLLSVSFSLDRDVRKITAKSVRGTIVDSEVSDLDDEALLVARFGNPDFLFLAKTTHDIFYDSNELNNLFWIDCRAFKDIQLGAGHCKLIEKYLGQL